MTPDSVLHTEPESQTGIIRRTPPPIHPSRVAASIQVPGPAVLVESQPQTRVTARTPPPSQTSRTAASVVRDLEVPQSTYVKPDIRRDAVVPSSGNATSRRELAQELPLDREPDEPVSKAPQDSRVDERSSEPTKAFQDVAIEQARNPSFISGSSSNGSHERSAHSIHDVTRTPYEPVQASPTSQTKLVGPQVAKSNAEHALAVTQVPDRKYEPPRAPEPAHTSNNPSYGKLFTSVSKPSEPARAQAAPESGPIHGEDQSAGRPQTQTLPSDGTPPSTLSADQFAMGATQHNHKLETSDANPPVRVQASAYGRPSATPDDSHNNKLPTDWREAIDRAMRSNHVQDTPVLHATAAASTVPISGDRAGPERFPYVEAESEAAPQQAVVPEKSAAYVAPGKWAGQEMRTAEVCTVHSTPHFDAVHIILPTNGTDVHFPCLLTGNVGRSTISKEATSRARRDASCIRRRRNASSATFQA